VRPVPLHHVHALPPDQRAHKLTHTTSVPTQLDRPALRLLRPEPQRPRIRPGVSHPAVRGRGRRRVHPVRAERGCRCVAQLLELLVPRLGRPCGAGSRRVGVFDLELTRSRVRRLRDRHLGFGGEGAGPAERANAAVRPSLSCVPGSSLGCTDAWPDTAFGPRRPPRQQPRRTLPPRPHLPSPSANPSRSTCSSAPPLRHLFPPPHPLRQHFRPTRSTPFSPRRPSRPRPPARPSRLPPRRRPRCRARSTSSLRPPRRHRRLQHCRRRSRSRPRRAWRSSTRSLPRPSRSVPLAPSRPSRAAHR